MRLEKVKVDITIAVGDNVEILDGPLNGTVGKISSIDENNASAKVVVELFGRETPVDVALDTLRKLEI